MHLEKRVLVTGGAGFLGSHLCERLLKSGASVICVDNYFTGTRRNIDVMLDHHRFELIRHDVTFPLYVEVDQIYNFACPASPIHYQHDPANDQDQRPRRHQYAGAGQNSSAPGSCRPRRRKFTAIPACIRSPWSIGARQPGRPALLLR